MTHVHSLTICGELLVNYLSQLVDFQELGINMTHIESRPSKSCPGSEYEFYADCEGVEDGDLLVEKLQVYASNISVLARSPKKDEGLYPLIQSPPLFSLSFLPLSLFPLPFSPCSPFLFHLLPLCFSFCPLSLFSPIIIIFL